MRQTEESFEKTDALECQRSESRVDLLKTRIIWQQSCMWRWKSGQTMRFVVKRQHMTIAENVHDAIETGLVEDVKHMPDSCESGENVIR